MRNMGRAAVAAAAWFCTGGMAAGANLQDIAHSAAAVYVAARDDGAVSRSNTNGVTYVVQSTGPGGALRGVDWSASNGGWFSAVGDGGRAVRSSDAGLTWTADATGTTNTLREVTAHGIYFIAVGDAGTTLRKLANAAVWDTTLSATTRNVNSVATNGLNPGILVAVGNGGLVLRSTDQGLSWNVLATLPGAPDMHGVTGTTTIFVAVGNGGAIFRSTNSGLDWTDVSNGSVTANLEDVATDGSRFVAAGTTGTVVRSGTSGAPGSWLQVVSGFATPIFGVHRDGTYFYATGADDRIYRSLDGTSWVNTPVEAATWSRVKRLFGEHR